MSRVPSALTLSALTLAGASLLLSACSASKPAPAAKAVAGRACQEPEELLDVLARFSTAVAAKDYHKALTYLSPEDQKQMLGPDGKVPEGIKAQLDALDFKALATDRRIDLVRGRLTGVFACLPCLDQGGPAPAVVETEPERRQRELEAADAETRARLEADRKAMAKSFYTYIQTGRWQKASGLVHPNEWELFLDGDGNLTDLSERRLQAMEECDLDALTLTDGVLTGLVLLLEPPLSDLYLKSQVFFRLVEEDRIEEAMAMVLESEKKFFRAEDGAWRPDRIAKLKALDPGEWRKLYLYHDVLLGVAEAAIGFEELRADGT